MHLTPEMRRAMERKPVHREAITPAIAVATIAKKKNAPEPKPTKWTKGEEKKLNQLVVADLRRRGIFVIVSRTDKASTNQVGLPDIVACYNGKIAMCELKAANGRLSDRQRECHAQLEAAGVPVCVAYNFDDAIRFVRENLNL